MGAFDLDRVNGNRKLISCRQVKFDQPGSLFVGRDGGDAAEVSVFDPVAVSFQ
jgi:hypothetical protein